MKKVHLIFALMALVGSIHLFGQTTHDEVTNKVNSIGYFINKSYTAKNIDKAVVDAIDEKAVSILKDYYLYGHCLDEFGSSGLSDATLQIFRGLFSGNAQVTADLDESKVGGLVPLSTYLEKIKLNFGKTGLHFDITVPSINRIVKDPLGNYRAELSFSKTMYLSMHEGQIERCEKGSEYFVSMILLFNPSAIEDAKIVEVSSVLQGPCFVLKKQNKLAFGVGFGYGLPSFTASPNFVKNMDPLKLEVGSSISVGVNATYLYLLSNTSKFYLKVGVDAMHTTISSSIKDGSYIKKDEKFFNVTYDPSIKLQFDRKINIAAPFSETHQLLVVGVPIGVRKVFGNSSSKLSFGLDLDVAPAFVASSLTSEWSGKVSYANSELTLDGDKVTLPVDSDKDGIFGTSFGLTQNNVIEKPGNLKVSSNLSFSTSLGALIQYQINKKYDFWVQPSVAYMLTPFLKSNDSEKFFLGGTPTSDGSVKDRITNGLTTNMLEDYGNGLKYLTIGLKAGLIIKL